MVDWTDRNLIQAVMDFYTKSLLSILGLYMSGFKLSPFTPTTEIPLQLGNYSDFRLRAKLSFCSD
jgi:hypothetical protein